MRRQLRFASVACLRPLCLFAPRIVHKQAHASCPALAHPGRAGKAPVEVHEYCDHHAPCGPAARPPRALTFRHTLPRVQALSTDYDPEASERFFSQRPLLVWRRLAEISARLGGLYLRAFLRGSARPASDDLCALLATLGPTFVKLGQTLSTREDLIGRDLARSLSGLQMAAPPFDDAVAFQVIRAELHDEPRGLYQRFPDTHVAAASLGQVYQAELHNLDNSSEDLVAVKVQRPNLLGSIALDVYALRIGLGVVRRLAKINSDLRKIADEVGAGLFAELDYRVEASQVRRSARA